MPKKITELLASPPLEDTDLFVVVDITDTTTKKATVGQIRAVTATPNVQTGTAYTLVAGDHQRIVTLNNAAAVVLTLPVLTAGFTCEVVQLGVGAVTFTGAGTTRRNRSGHTRTAGQFARATVSYHTATEFTLAGDTQA
jgi:hypothetical protein